MGEVLCSGEALIDMPALPSEDRDAPRVFVHPAGGAAENVAAALGAPAIARAGAFGAMSGPDEVDRLMQEPS